MTTLSKNLEVKKQNKEKDINKLEVQIKSLEEQIDKLKENNKDQLKKKSNDKNDFLQNCTHQRMITLKKENKDWFDYYQKEINLIKEHLKSKNQDCNIIEGIHDKIKDSFDRFNPKYKKLWYHSDIVNKVKFLEAGNFISESSDNKIVVWSSFAPWSTIVEKKMEPKTILASMSFIPSGEIIALVTKYKKLVFFSNYKIYKNKTFYNINIYETMHMINTRTLEEKSELEMKLSFNSSGDQLISVKKNNIKIWNVSDWNCVIDTKFVSNRIYSICINPKYDQVAIAHEVLDPKPSNDNTNTNIDDKKQKLNQVINIIDYDSVGTIKTIKILEEHTASIKALTYSPTGKLFVSGSDDKLIKIWDTSTWKCIKTLDHHRDRIVALCFHPSMKYLLSTAWDRTLKILKCDDWSVISQQKNKESSGCLLSLDFNMNGTMLVSGSEDKSIKLWDVGYLLDNKTNYSLFQSYDHKFSIVDDIYKLRKLVREFYKPLTTNLKNKNLEEINILIQSLKEKNLNLILDINKIDKDIRVLNNEKIEALNVLDIDSVENNKKDTKLQQLQKKLESLNVDLQNNKTSISKQEKELNKLEGQISKNDLELKDIQSEKTSHEKDLKGSYDHLDMKKRRIKLIFKIDEIVPMGIIDQDFKDRWEQYLTNDKHKD